MSLDEFAMSAKRDKRSRDSLPAEEEIEGSLVRLSGEVGGTFVPVQPRPAFREHLGDGLEQTMRSKANLRVAQPGGRRRWALIAGATVGSLIPLWCVAAYLVRSRLGAKPQHAVSP
jgi:hypothetical protein